MTKSPTGKRALQRSASRGSSSSGARPSRSSAPEFPNEWNEFIDCLTRSGARFLIVGAHALAVAGRPRFTQDLDIFVEPTKANAKRVCAAITEFGYVELGAEVEAFATPDRMAALGTVPLRIDIMTSISGVSFREAWKDRNTARVAGHEVAFLGVSALRKNKLASGRTKDQLDIVLLDEGK